MYRKVCKYNQTIDLPNISVQTLGTRLPYTVHRWNLVANCHVALVWQNPEETLKILESDEYKGSSAIYMMFQAMYLSFVHLVVFPLWHLPGFTAASRAVSLPQCLISGAALSCAKWWKLVVTQPRPQPHPQRSSSQRRRDLMVVVMD